MSTERIPSDDIPEPPRYLSDRAADWFSEVVEQYELEPHELRILTLACEALDEVEEARQIIDDEGLVITNSHGNRKRHPAASIRDAAATRFYRLVEKLGIKDEVQKP